MLDKNGNQTKWVSHINKVWRPLLQFNEREMSLVWTRANISVARYVRQIVRVRETTESQYSRQEKDGHDFHSFIWPAFMILLQFYCIYLTSQIIPHIALYQHECLVKIRSNSVDLDALLWIWLMHCEEWSRSNSTCVVLNYGGFLAIFQVSLIASFISH